MMNSSEIDRLVAEKVMGWKRTPYGWDVLEKKYNLGIEWDLPKFSTNIADAWKVVEKLQKDGWYIELYNENEEWCFDLTKYNEFLSVDRFYRASAEGASLAICLAALKACGIDVEV